MDYPVSVENVDTNQLIFMRSVWRKSRFFGLQLGELR